MIDINLTKKLAELSKLAFADEELESITKDMTEIIALMDMVKAADLNDEPARLAEVDYDDLREDTARESYDKEKILENAELVKNNSFIVPKVV